MFLSKSNRKSQNKEDERKIRKGRALPVPILSIQGAIMPEGFESRWDSHSISPKEIYYKIKDIKSYLPKPSHILVEINCPGGAVTASSEIGEMVEDLGKEYHTIGWVRDVAASGGYEVASYCREIYAHSTSMVGSIGVLLGSSMEFTQLIEKLGIKYRHLSAGEFKDIGSPFREMRKEEEDFLKHHLNQAHVYFKSVVQKNRKLSDEEIEKVSNGLFWHGSEAIDLKLIDRLGNLLDIEKRLQEEFQKEVIFLFEEEEEPSFWQQIFSFFRNPWISPSMENPSFFLRNLNGKNKDIPQLPLF